MNWRSRRVTASIALLSVIVVALLFTIRQLGTMTLRACAVPAEEMESVETDLFSTNYVVARQRFLGAAREAGGHIESIQHPDAGPEGNPLFMDVASFGNEGASRVLVVSSGTHGVEGFAGSGIQTRLLQDGIASRLPSEASLLLIHGINPYGMAHLRRVNEDDVDLNRNFRDHDSPYPSNPGYEQLADALGPTSISFWSEVASWSTILSFRVAAGQAATEAAVMRGQYSHPEGFSYGGSTATWSNTTLESVVSGYLSDVSTVVFVDLHTGLGDYGAAEVILNVPEDSSQYQRAVNIWGTALTRTTVTGDSVSTHLDASLKLALPGMLPAAEVTAVSLEFGTVPTLEALTAMRAEFWLHHHGGPDHPRATRTEILSTEGFSSGCARLGSFGVGTG